ncbi:MAG: protease HtpX [Gammaproteobacteria bacterium]|nr:protease HtpX [Gammaproteobacteria bacterium]MBU1623730.1 protease HtpX [Gammaproteobacteria bacterium]
MKRIFLFLVTNIAVLAVISITLRILGVDRWMDASGGINFNALLVLSAVIGFSGSIVSLLLSKWMAKKSTGAHVIENPQDPTERWLVDTVRRQAQAAGIGMPEVAIYDAPDVNAFATGWNRNNALVAVSTGLLHNMSRDEAEAVMAHEVSHVANGDMVTLALIQGVVNTFVVFFAKLFGYFVDRVLLKNDGRDGPGIGMFVAEIAAQIVLGILASTIVMWFSRQREFRADAGGASLAGRQKMIAALERLKSNHEQAAALPENMSAMAISSGGGFSRLFMTHPPLDERIEALRSGL